MNNLNIICLASGLLQFGVAWYVLRLNRLFKSTLAGWLLFGALTLLALFDFFLAVRPLDAGVPWAIKVEIIACLFSLLLLVGMVGFYSGLRNFLQAQDSERRALDEWESQVKERWAELNQTHARLQRTINRLEKEIAERKQAQENLQAQLAVSVHKEQVLQRAITGRQTEVIERPLAQPAPESAGQDREHPRSATPANGEKLRAGLAGGNAEIIGQPASEPIGKSGGQPLTARGGNGEKSQPAVASRDTVRKERRLTANAPAQSPENLLTAPRKSQEEPWDTAFLFHRKVAGRKSARTKWKKSAKAR